MKCCHSLFIPDYSPIVAVFAVTAKKKCNICDCTGWEFKNGLCSKHAASKPELTAAIEVYQGREPMQSGLIVTQQVSSPHYIALQSGEKVDILDIMSDNQSVIVRRADGGIGCVVIPFF